MRKPDIVLPQTMSKREVHIWIKENKIKISYHGDVVETINNINEFYLNGHYTSCNVYISDILCRDNPPVEWVKVIEDYVDNVLLGG